MKSRRQSKGKVIRPTFFVFCEGESEEAYVKYLRSKYRLPIEICPSVAGLGITQDSITRFKKGKPVAAKDRDFLIYDLDRDEILEKLKAIKGATIIASNPCLELWYLLHYVDQKAEMTSAQCLSSLKRHLQKYKKGEVGAGLQAVLAAKQEIAVKRAGALPARQNPSSDMPVFLEALEGESKRRVRG